MPFPFEVSFADLQADLETHVDAVFGCLESEFLVMPKGKGFVEFPVFESGYEALKRATGGFRNVTPDTVQAAVFKAPMALIVKIHADSDTILPVNATNSGGRQSWTIFAIDTVAVGILEFRPLASRWGLSSAGRAQRWQR